MLFKPFHRWVRCGAANETRHFVLPDAVWSRASVGERDRVRCELRHESTEEVIVVAASGRLGRQMSEGWKIIDELRFERKVDIAEAQSLEERKIERFVVSDLDIAEVKSLQT